MAQLVIKGISAFAHKLDVEMQDQLTFGHTQLAFPFLSSALLGPVLLLLGHLPCSSSESTERELWGPLGMLKGDLPEGLQAYPTC